MYIVYIYILHIYRNFKLEEAAFGDTQACKYRKTTSDCIMSNNCPTFMASEFHALVFFATPTRHHWCQSPPIHLQLDRFNVCFPGSAGTDWS